MRTVRPDQKVERLAIVNREAPVWPAVKARGRVAVLQAGRHDELVAGGAKAPAAKTLVP